MTKGAKVKSLILVFSFLLTCPCIAQHKIEPSAFDTFIKQPNIEWASYLIYYEEFEKKDFNKMLSLRLARKEIDATTPYYPSDLDYLDKDSIDKLMLYPRHYSIPILDSLGRVIIYEPKKAAKVDTALFTQTNITQILYVESGILKSYVTWVTPMKPIKTMDEEIFLGYNEYFATCFNPRHDHLPSPESNIECLGKITMKLRLDTIQHGFQTLKELYGKNFIESLWPHILDGGAQVFSLELQRRLTTSEIYSYIPGIKKESDDFYLSLNKSIKPGDFTSFDLVQDWFYSYTENIVFNKIRELYLYARKWTTDGQEKEPSAILRIIFK